MKHKTAGFLIKTYQMLQNQELSHIISWNSQGNGFLVHNSNQFSTKVLPIYFKHNNFQSFVRQLNMYGFHKIRTSKIENHYSHPQFVRGTKSLISQISRKAEKKNPKINMKGQMIDEQISIQLQSQTEQNIKGKVGLWLYGLMKTNKILLAEQFALLGQIKKDAQQEAYEHNFVQICKQYLNAQLNLLNYLDLKSVKEMKDSERYIQSMLDTQPSILPNQEHSKN